MKGITIDTNIKRAPITNKREMYRLLDQGSFGNTIPSWFSVEAWLPEAAKAPNWGVRTLTVGGPCRLFCPTDEVADTFDEYVRCGHQAQISCMIDNFVTVTLMVDIYQSDTGLVVYGIHNPDKGANWRRDMPTKGKHYTGIAARRLLAQCLNPNSLDDLWAVLDLWPDHIVELSAMDRCFGRIPGRNAVIWECRLY